MSNVKDQLSSEFPDLEVPSDTPAHKKSNSQNVTDSEFPDLEVPSLPTFKNDKKESKRKKRALIFQYLKEDDLDSKNISKNKKARLEAEGFEVRLVELKQKKKGSFSSELKSNEAVTKDAVEWLKGADDCVCEIVRHGTSVKKPNVLSEGKDTAKALLAVGLKDDLKQMHIRYQACHGINSKEATRFFNHLYKAGVRNFIGDAIENVRAFYDNSMVEKYQDIRLKNSPFHAERQNELRKQLGQNIGNQHAEKINFDNDIVNMNKAGRGYSFSVTKIKLDDDILTVREPSHAISKKTGLFRNVTYFMVGPGKKSKMHETKDPSVLKKFFEKYRKGKSEIKVANLTPNPAPVSELISDPKYQPTTPSVATTAKRANRKEREKIKAAPILSRTKKKFGLKR